MKTNNTVIDISNRTKGDWVLSKRGIAVTEYSLHNKEGEYIGMFSYAIARPALMKEAKIKGEANAAFIVTACNNHDALVKGLESAMGTLVLACLIDKSNTCEKEVDKIEQLLNQIKEQSNETAK